LDAKLAPLDEGDGPFDVVLANVGRAAVTELAAPLTRVVAPGGWLAVSGISPSQCSLVAAFLAPLVEIERRSSGEWAAIVLAPA
jgi:ribosomal protein L11 methylase PrmA